jgi:hypothetical protein
MDPVRLRVNYSETTAVSEFVDWMSSKPPVVAQAATTTIVMSTKVIKTRLPDRDPFPT